MPHFRCAFFSSFTCDPFILKDHVIHITRIAKIFVHLFLPPQFTAPQKRTIPARPQRVYAVSICGKPREIARSDAPQRKNFAPACAKKREICSIGCKKGKNKRGSFQTFGIFVQEIVHFCQSYPHFFVNDFRRKQQTANASFGIMLS